ncbi:hypothetical protein BDP55DRAFT_103344 [Colletotrichum godetiae]|uniref:Uncharacterized protein n=1 Tax=Colletotrichum godetiae TaxID=1209918 RepID=A0AAJ0AN51_9PEZI|nr:uncharacterized protein BDP55DRAFT_103344 [Colletotrichum godetiae]KAK1676950.1 hypothetical protein BDP55DRAFT_103344 [Colletotrichum godetiae]
MVFGKVPPAADDESTVRTTLKPQLKHLKGRHTAPPTGANTKLLTPLLRKSHRPHPGTAPKHPIQRSSAASHMIMREAPGSVMRVGLLDVVKDS